MRRAPFPSAEAPVYAQGSLLVGRTRGFPYLIEGEIMSSVFRRFAVGGLLVFGLALVAVSSAEAQIGPSATNEASLTPATIDVDAAVRPLVATDRSASSSVLRPKLNASFLRQGGAANEDSGIGFGVLGMITRASIDVDDSPFDPDSRTGYGFGVWVGGNRNGRIGFVGEFIYLTRKASEDDEDITFKVLEIPAVFHVNFGSRSRNSVGGYVVVGPVFAINLGQTIDGEDFDEGFGGADIGIIGGAGIEVYRIGIEARGNWGLRSISDEGDTTKIKTFTFELLGKFAFN
jgi:hypothetical protein